MKVWHVNMHWGRRKVRRTFTDEAKARDFYDALKAEWLSTGATFGRKDYLGMCAGEA